MSACQKLPFHSPQRRLLDHMLQCDGGWLAEDPAGFNVSTSTLMALESRGYAVLERHEEEVVAAFITRLGVAAAAWGMAAVHQGEACRT